MEVRSISNVIQNNLLEKEIRPRIRQSPGNLEEFRGLALGKTAAMVALNLPTAPPPPLVSEYERLQMELDRKIRLFRLPSTLETCSLSETVSVSLIPDQDNPIWIRVTTEDGFNAWSSPIYVTP